MGTAGGLDFGTGSVTFRDKSRPRLSLHPGNLPDTRLAMSGFLAAVPVRRYRVHLRCPLFVDSRWLR